LSGLVRVQKLISKITPTLEIYVNITTIKMKNLTHTLEIVVNINVFLLVLIVKYPPLCMSIG